MKKMNLIALVSFLLAFSSLQAQNPVPDPDTASNPIKQGDPALQTLPPRLDYVEDKKRITPEEIPQPVRQTLESSAQYTDWEKADIFHDDNKDEYIVEFKDAGKSTTYRFNKEGAPIIEE